MRVHDSHIIFLALGCAFAACKRSPETQGDRPVLATAPRPMFPTPAVLHERSGQGRIAYLGLDMTPANPERGQVVKLVHYFRVDAPCANDWDVFLHGEIPGGARVLVGDHAPAQGRFRTSTWEAGEIWRDEDTIAVPKDLAGTQIELFAGFFKGEVRMTVEAPPGGSDGQDRVRVATISIGGEGPKDDLPSVVVKRASAPITADGVLSEDVWAAAEVMTFADSMGRGSELRYPTKLRLLFDDTNLYVAFESTDEDISDPFSKRDDPIYDHEAVEVFIMPNVSAPGLGPYVEMQASPSGVIFDAAFTARRQNMDKTFDAGQTVGTKVDGTLNSPGDVDRGWVSEWIVPWKGIRGVSAPPKDGDEWRMNAFRIEKNRAGSNEYTAWSPPRVGDFHNTARFGRMKFGAK